MSACLPARLPLIVRRCEEHNDVPLRHVERVQDFHSDSYRIACLNRSVRVEHHLSSLLVYPARVHYLRMHARNQSISESVCREVA